MNSQISSLTADLAEKSNGLLDAHVRLDEMSDSLAALSNGIYSHLT